jgi:hypothetical protein
MSREQLIRLGLEKAGGDLLALMAAWDQRCKSSTAATYTRTALRLRPELRTTEVMRYLDCLRQEATILASRRALAAAPQDIQKILRAEPPKTRRTIRLLWVTASRHADLGRMASVQLVSDNVWMAKWGAMKGDRYGQRCVTKFFFWKGTIPRPFASYRTVLEAMKKTNQDLTAHSVRRGAVTFLSDQGYPNNSIAMLTGHAPTSDPHLAIRRYADPSPNQPESKLQIQMSKALWESLC